MNVKRFNLMSIAESAWGNWVLYSEVEKVVDERAMLRAELYNAEALIKQLKAALARYTTPQLDDVEYLPWNPEDQDVK